MNAPKRHHYVPQFYLNGFASQKGQIECFERQTCRRWTTSTANAAVQTGFYDLDTPADGKSKEVEEWFSDLERQAASLFGAIADGYWDKSTPSSSDREFLAQYMAAQFRRTPESRAQLDAIFNLGFRAKWDWIITREGAEGAKRELQQVTGRDFTDEEIASAVDQAHAFIQDGAFVDHNTHVLRIFDFLNDTATWFHGLKWRLCIAANSGLVTSDRPVVLWRRLDNADDRDGVAVIDATHTYFPLDSQRLLVMSQHFGSEWSAEYVTPRDVRKYNERIANWSTRFVYFRPGSDPLRNLRIPRYGPGIAVNGVYVHDNVDLLPVFREAYLAASEPPEFELVYGVMPE